MMMILMDILNQEGVIFIGMLNLPLLLLYFTFDVLMSVCVVVEHNLLLIWHKQAGQA